MTPQEYKTNVNFLLNAGKRVEQRSPATAGKLYREAYDLTRDPIIRRWALAAEAAAAVAA